MFCFTFLGASSKAEKAPPAASTSRPRPRSASFGYIGDLRTMTSGCGQFSMEFSHYAPCPKNVSDDVIAKAKHC